MTTTLGKVYTLSPTFRAEKSLTRHHLAEFYMLEVELIDIDRLDQLLDVAEALVKNVSLDVFDKFSRHDMDFILNGTKGSFIGFIFYFFFFQFSDSIIPWLFLNLEELEN